MGTFQIYCVIEETANTPQPVQAEMSGTEETHWRESLPKEEAEDDSITRGDCGENVEADINGYICHMQSDRDDIVANLILLLNLIPFHHSNG